jgi:hypothetical protein
MTLCNEDYVCPFIPFLKTLQPNYDVFQSDTYRNSIKTNYYFVSYAPHSAPHGCINFSIGK